MLCSSSPSITTVVLGAMHSLSAWCSVQSGASCSRLQWHLCVVCCRDLDVVVERCMVISLVSNVKFAGCGSAHRASASDWESCCQGLSFGGSDHRCACAETEGHHVCMASPGEHRARGAAALLVIVPTHIGANGTRVALYWVSALLPQQWVLVPAWHLPVKTWLWLHVRAAIPPHRAGAPLGAGKGWGCTSVLSTLTVDWLRC
jgi:hypothetical protein